MKRYLYKVKGLFILNIILIIVSSTANIVVSLTLKSIVDTAYSKDIATFSGIMAFAVVFLLACFLVDYLSQLLHASFIKKIMINLKNDIFFNILNKPIKEFFSENSAQYISTLTNDAAILESDYFNNLLGMIGSIFSFCIAAVVIIKLSVYIALGVFITGIVTIIIPGLFGNKISISKKNYSDSIASFTTHAKDVFSGFEVIKSFNIEPYIKKEYVNHNTDVENRKYSFYMISCIVNLLSRFFGSAMFFTAIGIGTYLCIKGSLTVGSMIAAIQLMNNVVSPIMDMAARINSFKSKRLIEEKIEKIMQIKDNSDTGTEKSGFENRILFENVSFSYTEEHSALDSLSFQIEKGCKYAIVGKSGSGKSTILKLLIRYYDSYEGNIYIDGTDIRQIKFSDLYKMISVIHQNIFMFDSSIRDNVTLYQDYSEEALKRALKLSGLEGLIESLQYGEDSPVGENGCNLSGGERQRISIARALIKKTPVLILDEATSSLDNETAYNIENSLLDIPELTCMVVTHKLHGELLKKYDKILVLNGGRLVEMGSFDELIGSKSHFYNLYHVYGA